MRRHINFGAVAVAIVDITGHRQGTPEHEAIYGRVLGNFANGDLAVLRSDDRGATVVLNPADFRVAVRA